MPAADNNRQDQFLNPFAGVSDREHRPRSPSLGQDDSISLQRSSSSFDMTSSLDTTHLTVQNIPPRTSHSIDGETLRSRSDSTFSQADTYVRSRANSEVPLPAPSKSAVYDDVSVSDALNPDPRNVQDFQIDDNKFAFSPGQLNKMQNPKSIAAFQALGGLRGLERGLRTDLTSGLSVDEAHLVGTISFDEATSSEIPKQPQSQVVEIPPPSEASSQFQDRIRIYSQNRLPARKSTGILKLLWLAYNDKIIILLTIAAVVSLSLGVYETVSSGHGVDWIEGVAICVAILIVTIVTAANDWQKERQFVKLNKRNNDREVKAVRSGKVAMISIYDITVGDVLHVEPGDSIPADGVLVSGHGVKCDESSATGESDQMKKTDGYEVWRQICSGATEKKLDPFMISGGKVLEGVGTYLVTSVGKYSTYGRIMLSLQESNDPTPLQVKLGGLANWIGWLGSGAAIVLFFALLIRFLAELPNNNAPPAIKGKEFVDILIVAVTVIVVAIPEGLPLAVTLALAFATTRMVKENNLVRVLRACETMGNATVICSDKTGTLTQNKMTVVAGTLGSQSFVQDTQDDSVKAPMSVAEMFKTCSPKTRDLIIKSIALNSTAFEEERDGAKEFIGSKTEVALLLLARDYLGMDVATERGSAEIVQLIPFDSARKCMGVVYRDPVVGYRLLVKGAAEIMVGACTSKVTALDQDLSVDQLSEEDTRAVLDTIENYAGKSLRTIGLVYRDFPHVTSWPPKGTSMEDDPASADFAHIFREATWVGAVGIQDPLRPEVPAAIKKCHGAGVQVKMVTGDNVATATAIASSCGIKTDEGIVLEGPKFRQLSDEEMDQVIPRLQVLARSSPEDKRILVARLKKLGETVAVTGDGTNDGPALKTADVGFSMGIAGTEVAKEASSIILLDDNFKSIVTAISWGRAVNDAVAKFLQFQITVNITAVALTFVSSLYSSSNESVLNAVQLLWVNLIMDTFAALALATDAPTEKILDRKPAPKSASLFTVTMWKMILGQAVYQLAITFMLYFAGRSLLGDNLSAANGDAELSTIVFNTFVWMQIFNEFNNRRLDHKLNIFEGMFRNYWFLGINCIMVAGQIMIVYVGGQAFGVTPLTSLQWGVCIICAIGCLPWAVVLRTIPDKPFGIALDYIVRGFTFVLRPICKGLGHLATLFRAVLRPVKRVAQRTFHPRANNNHTETHTGPSDVEAASLSDLKRDPSPVPPPQPSLAVPQVTITTS